MNAFGLCGMKNLAADRSKVLGGDSDVIAEEQRGICLKARKVG